MWWASKPGGNSEDKGRAKRNGKRKCTQREEKDNYQFYVEDKENGESFKGVKATGLIYVFSLLSWYSSSWD